jgi:hypothetical protein
VRAFTEKSTDSKRLPEVALRCGVVALQVSPVSLKSAVAGNCAATMVTSMVSPLPSESVAGVPSARELARATVVGGSVVVAEVDGTDLAVDVAVVLGATVLVGGFVAG